MLFWNDIVVIYCKEQKDSEVRGIILYMVPSAVLYAVCIVLISSGWLELLLETIALIGVGDYCD